MHPCVHTFCTPEYIKPDDCAIENRSIENNTAFVWDMAGRDSVLNYRPGVVGGVAERELREVLKNGSCGRC
jgi:hypothetical protein